MYAITLDSIVEIIHNGKVCILICQPQVGVTNFL